MATLQLDNVSKSFGNQRVILPLNLDIPMGNSVFWLALPGAGNPPCCVLSPGWRRSRLAAFILMTMTLPRANPLTAALHGVSVLCALPTYDGRAEYWLRARNRRFTERRNPANRAPHCRSVANRPPAEPQTPRAFRRPAPARCHWTRHQPRSKTVPA